MMKEPNFVKAMRPYAEAYYAMYGAIRELLEPLSDEQLIALRADSTKLTPTNCGWGAYAAAPLVRQEIGSILHGRQKDSEKVPND